MRKKREPKEKKVFIPKVLQVFIQNAFKGHVSRLQVMQWNVDGKDTKPKLERRDYRVKEDGTESIGRGGGLTREDCAYLVAHWDEIGMFL